MSIGANIVRAVTDQVNAVKAAVLAQLAAAGGALLVGFQQSGVGAAVQTLQAKARQLVCVDDYGADPTGVADSADAIEAAWAAVKVAGAVKRGIYGQGKYRLARAVALAGNDDLTLTSDLGTNARIELATITPDAGIGVAITLSNVRRPVVRLVFSYGGNEAETDVGFEFFNVEAMDFEIRGSNYRGLLLKYDGSKGSWGGNSAGVVFGRKCYKLMDLRGASGASHSSGCGRIASVWDILPTKGSVLQYLDDLTIEHYETATFTPTFTATSTVNVADCSSIHFGTVALGMQGDNLMTVSGCQGVHIKELYVFGGNVSGGGTSVGLLHYNNALFTVDRLSAYGCAKGVRCGGNSNFEVGNLQALNNGNDVTMENVLGSSANMNLSLDRYFSQGAYAEAIKGTAGITGTLTIGGGRVRSGNVGAAALVGIDTSLSGAGLFTRCDDLEIDASWATSVKTVSRLKFAGNGNNFQGATPIQDATGRKGSLDGRTWLIDVPALAVATTYTNANPYPVALWVPMRFEAGALATDYATLKLIDYEGIAHDLVDTRYAGTAPAAVQYFTLKAIVPAGWSYRIEVANAARVTLQGVPRSVRV